MHNSHMQGMFFLNVWPNILHLIVYILQKKMGIKFYLKLYHRALKAVISVPKPLRPKCFIFVTGSHLQIQYCLPINP